MRSRREPKNKVKKKVYLRNHNMCFFTCSPRPPTLSQRHVDLHVWSYPRLDYIPSFIEICSAVSEPRGVKIWPFPLLWLVAFTTACTTVQAVTSRERKKSTKKPKHVTRHVFAETTNVVAAPYGFARVVIPATYSYTLCLEEKKQKHDF